MGNKANKSATIKKGTTATVNAIGEMGESQIGQEGDEIEIKYSSIIGEGGFSTVYKVKETKSSRNRRNTSQSKSPKKSYAIKRMICKDDEWIIRCEEEIKMHRICVHTNVLPLLACSSVRKPRGITEYLLMLPLCSRGGLQDSIDCANNVSIKRNQKISAFTESECLSIFSSICKGVKALHSAGFAHRDLKPANILFSTDNIPMVMDLGSCAKTPIFIETSRDADLLYDTASVHSTPSYRAPELFMTAYPCDIGVGTDVWSLGCILYAMLFGRSPFEFGQGGSFERLAVMNGNVLFSGHGCLESTQWRGSGERKVIHTVGLIELIRDMLCPDVTKRITMPSLMNQMTIFISNDNVANNNNNNNNYDMKPGNDESDEEKEEDGQQDTRTDRKEYGRNNLAMQSTNPLSVGLPTLAPSPMKRDSWTEIAAARATTEGSNANENGFEVDWNNCEEKTEKKKTKKKKKKKKKHKKSSKTTDTDDEDDDKFGEFSKAKV